MKNKWVLFLVCLAMVGPLCADLDYGVKPSPRYRQGLKPVEGTTLDPRSGFTYKWRTDRYGDTTAKGTNDEGATNEMVIKKNGDMSGIDSHGNYWNYDKASGMYYNYGTGEARLVGNKGKK